MSTLVLDTNVVSYIMRSDPLSKCYRPLLEGHTLAISFMTVGELYEGAYRAGWGDQKMKLPAEQLQRYVVIPWSFETARQWGTIRAERRQQPIAVDDAWIATTAKTHSCPLVTHNPNGFKGIEGLKVITAWRRSTNARGEEGS